ncbi:MAG: HesA/MoeB/ThiF family protein [Oligoflexia bacterium]|nr:HesA/MoeB/ThiF family protein [Oligoflexia bacterium]
MNKNELIRYDRHFLLKEVGEAGQKKLKKSSVLIVGIGGLGSPVALYLAAAGIGRLGLVDFDDISESNLQRQIIYSTADIGKPKVKQAAKHLKELNPWINIKIYQEKLSPKNASEIFSRYDIVIDGADNFSTRYLINDAALIANIPLVSASILGFEGQLAVFNYKKGPCYRCLYPEPPPSGSVLSCSEHGVLGVLPGIFGTLQATETIKIILGLNNNLGSYLIYFDAIQMDFQKMQLTKNPHCLCNGDLKKINLNEIHSSCEFLFEISCEDFAKLKNNEEVLILDVREQEEWDSGHILGAKHVPLSLLREKIPNLEKKKIVAYCRGGKRSQEAVEILRKNNYQAESLRGGYLAWCEMNERK